MKKAKKSAAIKRRDFLKAGAAAGAAATFEGAAEALKGAEDKKEKVSIVVSGAYSILKDVRAGLGSGCARETVTQ